MEQFTTFFTELDPVMVPKPMDAVVVASLGFIWVFVKWMWPSSKEVEVPNFAEDLEMARKALEERDAYIKGLLEELQFYKSALILQNVQTPPLEPEETEENAVAAEEMPDLNLPPSANASDAGDEASVTKDSTVSNEEAYTPTEIAILKFLKKQTQPKSIGEINAALKLKGIVQTRRDIEAAVQMLQDKRKVECGKIDFNVVKMYRYCKWESIPTPPMPTVRSSPRLAQKRM